MYAQKRDELMNASLPPFKEAIEQAEALVKELSARPKSHFTIVKSLAFASLDNESLKRRKAVLHEQWQNFVAAKSDFYTTNQDFRRLQQSTGGDVPIEMNASTKEAISKLVIDFSSIEDLSEVFASIHKENDEECIKGLERAYILLGGDGDDDSPKVSKMRGDATGFEIVYIVLKLHLNDPSFAIQALRVIRKFALSVKQSNILSELGTCEKMCEALYAHLDKENVFEEAVSSILNMALQDKENTEKFCKAGACDSVLTGLSRYKASEPVVFQCVKMFRIFAVASRDAAKKLMEKGVCSAVIDAIKSLPEVSPRLLEHFCRFCNVIADAGKTSADDQNNRTALGEAGALEFLTSLAHKNCSNPEFVGWICKSIGELAADNNQNKVNLFFFFLSII